jgi:type II secretory pathway component GspD/PulD (secretin)
MLVVGGLIDESETDDDTKVPILGDIPIVEKLFKSNTRTSTKKELVVLLLPKIIS